MSPFGTRRSRDSFKLVIILKVKSVSDSKIEAGCSFLQLFAALIGKNGKDINNSKIKEKTEVFYAHGFEMFYVWKKKRIYEEIRLVQNSL